MKYHEILISQNVIKDVHTAVVDSDLTMLSARTAPPVPAALASAKDINGLTPLHKAAGLNNLPVVEYLLTVYPAATRETDATGKTPLHWAASPEIFNKLVRAGADEQAYDYVTKLYIQSPIHMILAKIAFSIFQFNFTFLQ